MFKLTQLLNKGRQVKELKEIQKEKERIQEELDGYEIFPECPHETRKYIGGETKAIEELSATLMLVFLGKVPFATINNYCCDNFKLKDEETQNFFKEVGNYFFNLGENFETRKPLEERLAELCEKEKKLKEKLGIK